MTDTLPAPQAAPMPQAAAPFDLFSPAGLAFRPVSPRLNTAWQLTNLLSWSPFLLAGLILALVHSPWWLFLAAFSLLGLAWIALLIPRRVRAIAYCAREADLIIKWGVLWKQMTAVPYGRMQYVDVSAGPIDRWLGISTVRLRTASAGTDASIEGLPAEEAAWLKDLITERGQARLAGL